MTWRMFSIGYLELNNSADAARLFKKQEGNVAAPYNVGEWSFFFFFTQTYEFQVVFKNMFEWLTYD